MSNDLRNAKRGKNDEFYTQLTDIEKELRHYTRHFKDKVVYCNCDDPSISNFFRYFQLKFRSLGLKKLITTCYKNQNLDLFSKHDREASIGITIAEKSCNTDLPNFEVFKLKGNGDFRSQESIELLKQSDIVVTNPPFSLFRQYASQLIEYNKKFIIIGNMNAITYKEFFPLIMNDLVWAGPSITSGDREFGVPPHYPLNATGQRVDKNGNRYIRVKGVRWFTNLDHSKRHEELDLYKRYSPDEYPHYDNYDAINVDRVSDIPEDYPGIMGVPITFLDKFNPDQFEIVGITKPWFKTAVKVKTYPQQIQVNATGKRSEVSKLNDGAALQVYGPVGKTHYIVNGRYYVQAYARMLIRNKRLQE